LGKEFTVQQKISDTTEKKMFIAASQIKPFIPTAQPTDSQDTQLETKNAKHVASKNSVSPKITN
jgi:hypothetical protein